MTSWGDEPSIPERIPDWKAIDVLLIVLGFLVITVIGVVAAGGPS